MQKAIQEISAIIQRDSKTSTYKFALLKASIEIVQEYDHYLKKEGSRVTIPLGLVVLKWIEFYYPLFDYVHFIPQINGDSRGKSLAFRNVFNQVIEYYKDGLGFLQLQKELKTGEIDGDRKEAVARLVKKISEALVRMPMHYIGSAIGRDGKIFNYNKDSVFRVKLKGGLNNLRIIQDCGTFSIPTDY